VHELCFTLRRECRILRLVLLQRSFRAHDVLLSRTWGRGWGSSSESVLFYRPSRYSENDPRLNTHSGGQPAHAGLQVVLFDAVTSQSGRQAGRCDCLKVFDRARVLLQSRCQLGRFFEASVGGARRTGATARQDTRTRSAQ
jgi:hypothetical protein